MTKVLEEINIGIQSIKDSQFEMQQDFKIHEKEEWTLLWELKVTNNLLKEWLKSLNDKHRAISSRTDKHEVYIRMIVVIIFIIVFYLWIQH